jgi:hypothetical protein
VIAGATLVAMFLVGLLQVTKWNKGSVSQPGVVQSLNADPAGEEEII